MKDWEDIIKERQLSRKAELPESDWNDFLSRKAAHECAVIRRRRLMTFSISIPAAAAVLLLLFLMPFKKAVPENRTAQNNQPEQQVITDSISDSIDSITIEKPQVEIAQVKQESKPEEKSEVNTEIKTGRIYGGTTVFGESTNPVYDSKTIVQDLSVKGSVYDFDSEEPLNYAAVQIYRISGTDSTYVGGTSTDDDGSFIINNLMPGNYVARTTYVGFDDVDRNFTLRSGSTTADLGKIAMRGNRMLAEVAVTAVVAKVQMVNDTVAFNSVAYRLPEGTSVEDLIRKLPGVEIDSAGNLTVNGKAISRILVNGKEFFNDDKTKSLTQLTAEMIEKVKAYDQQSDLSRQTGIADGAQDTVLDMPVAGMNTLASTFKTPLIVFDGNVVEVDKDRLAAFDFSKSYNDRDSLSSLLGVRRGKINVIRAVQGVEALKEWGPKGVDGVLEVFSGKYYRKSMRAGKLNGGPYETVPRSKRTQ